MSSFEHKTTSGAAEIPNATTHYNHLVSADPRPYAQYAAAATTEITVPSAIEHGGHHTGADYRARHRFAQAVAVAISASAIGAGFGLANAGESDSVGAVGMEIVVDTPDRAQLLKNNVEYLQGKIDVGGTVIDANNGCLDGTPYADGAIDMQDSAQGLPEVRIRSDQPGDPDLIFNAASMSPNTAFTPSDPYTNMYTETHNC